MRSHDTFFSECAPRGSSASGLACPFSADALMMQTYVVAGRVEARPHRDACMARPGCAGLLCQKLRPEAGRLIDRLGTVWEEGGYHL